MFQYKRCILYTALMSLLLTPQAAIADKQPVFSIYDTDHNGYLSRAEYAMFSEKMHRHRRSSNRPCPEILEFSHVDHDQDGQISESELLASLNKGLQKRRRYRFKNGAE